MGTQETYLVTYFWQLNRDTIREGVKRGGLFMSYQMKEQDHRIRTREILADRLFRLA